MQAPKKAATGVGGGVVVARAVTDCGREQGEAGEQKSCLSKGADSHRRINMTSWQ